LVGIRNALLKWTRYIDRSPSLVCSLKMRVVQLLVVAFGVLAVVVLSPSTNLQQRWTALAQMPKGIIEPPRKMGRGMLQVTSACTISTRCAHLQHNKCTVYDLLSFPLAFYRVGTKSAWAMICETENLRRCVFLCLCIDYTS